MKLLEVASPRPSRPCVIRSGEGRARRTPPGAVTPWTTGRRGDFGSRGRRGTRRGKSLCRPVAPHQPEAARVGYAGVPCRSQDSQNKAAMGRTLPRVIVACAFAVLTASAVAGCGRSSMAWIRPMGAARRRGMGASNVAIGAAWRRITGRAPGLDVPRTARHWRQGRRCGGIGQPAWAWSGVVAASRAWLAGRALAVAATPACAGYGLSVRAVSWATEATLPCR